MCPNACFLTMVALRLSSSWSSRISASSGDSSRSTVPPGNSHLPALGSFSPRLIARKPLSSEDSCCNLNGWFVEHVRKNPRTSLDASFTDICSTEGRWRKDKELQICGFEVPQVCDSRFHCKCIVLRPLTIRCQPPSLRHPTS